MADTNKMPGYVYQWQDGKLLPVKIPGFGEDGQKVEISDALDSDSSATAASSKAVKLVNDKAVANALAIEQKAGKSEMTSALALKADKTALEEGLAGKISRSGDSRLTGFLRIVYKAPAALPAPNNLSFLSFCQHIEDPSDVVIGKVYHEYGIMANGLSVASMSAMRRIGEQDKYAFLSLCFEKDGTIYGLAPNPPANSCANVIDTTQGSINRHPLKVTDIQVHVGGANASDTADLFSGRGLSADKPFATLLAAINFINHNYLVANRAMFILHSDITITDRQRILVKNMGMCAVCSDDTKRTITLEGSAAYLDMWGGCFAMWDVNVQLNGARNFIRSNSVYGFATVYLGNQFDTASHAVNLNGTVTVATIEASGGSVYLHDELTGSVTGKRYACANGGRIITNGRGVNAIPGTIAGTCDESSIYA